MCLLASSACGTRRSTEELVAAARVETDRVEPSPDAAQVDPGTAPTGGGPADVGNESSGVGGSGGATPDSAPGATVPGAAIPASCTKPLSEIRIGSVGQMSGPIGAVFAPVVKSVQVWAAMVNAAGGIDCHPIRYFTADDGGDPSRHQALVQRMVESDRVIAFVGMGAPLTGDASVSYLERRRIPAIGTEPSDRAYRSPMQFAQMASADLFFEAAFAATGTVAKKEGVKRLATISCIEARLCSGVYDIAGGLSGKYGLDLVYRGQVSLVQPDYTSSCQAAKNAGAEFFFLGLDAGSILRVVRSCESVNYRPRYVVTAQSVSAASLASPSLEGQIVGMNVQPWTAKGTPGIDEFNRALAEFGAGLAPDASAEYGWLSAKLFQAAVTGKLSADPTSQEVLEGLWSIEDEDLGGMTTPLTFLRDQNSPQVFCYWPAEVRGGKLVSTNGFERICP